ncbi:hypothetical protein NQ318_021866 [Aromia moschata]|uniref:Uncharacterized protein n=1 Tax=Aromia moschata TaxID=1265417 RepID=A0AAV8Z800_9CUCU|nr:hypothetical protein NQ318_021866 [Aromia moschata]
MWFMHDGAPPHFALPVCLYYMSIFLIGGWSWKSICLVTEKSRPKPSGLLCMIIFEVFGLSGRRSIMTGLRIKPLGVEGGCFRQLERALASPPTRSDFNW